VTDLYELAKHFVCMIVAATLSLTVSVVESMLPRRPEWVEKTALLAAQFQALSDGENMSRAGGPEAPEAAGETQGIPPVANLPVDLQGLVDGYSKLLEFTQHVKVRGLMLDPEFCERVEREWSVKTLLSYMITAEKSLKEQAADAHDEAASLLSARNANN
tara:strand:+ start:5094 stop:5573 length:480 start_codon:yes stop_codon:yes gene_type:complete